MGETFSFVGTAAFGGTLGQIRDVLSGTTLKVMIDTQKAGTANFEILFTNLGSVVAGDFKL